jgi:colicin import membrane protein
MPFYGWRYIQCVGPDGKVELEEKLLTLEDVLHPQEDDVIPENTLHESERRYVSDVADTRESRLDRGLILKDCIVDWGIPGLGNHCPDLSVFAGLKKRPKKPFGTFRLRPSGGRCVAALEIVSPHTRKNDVLDKLDEYHQAKVPLYIIVDQKKEDGPRELLAYRYTPARYVKVKLDDFGRVLLKELGIWLGLKDNHLLCYDEAANEELGDYTKIAEDNLVQKQARLEAERLAREAEHQAREAERHGQEQAEARQAAEQRANQQAAAREAAENRVQELEAALRRLQEKNR